jgi:hypothetical protein
MNTTLAVVVSAIVLLITALVVITIFGNTIGNFGTLSNANSICETQARSSCSSTGMMPITWNIATVKDNQGNPQTCQAATTKPADCSLFGGTAAGGGTSGSGTGSGSQTGCCQTGATCKMTSSSDCPITVGTFSSTLRCVSGLCKI